jgi:hypothetical protein
MRDARKRVCLSDVELFDIKDIFSVNWLSENVIIYEHRRPQEEAHEARPPRRDLRARLDVHFAPPPDRLGAFFLLTSG